MINYNPMNSLRILLIFIREYIFYILRGEIVKIDRQWINKSHPPKNMTPLYKVITWLINSMYLSLYLSEGKRKHGRTTQRKHLGDLKNGFL